MIDLPFRPDRESAEPLHRQLADCLRALVASDRLPSGAKLPATRELATSLGLSRSTVTIAYEDLIAEGTLRAHVGQGTFVLGRAPLRRPATAPASAREFVWSGLFAQRARLLAPPDGLPLLRRSQTIRFDFRGGRVDADSLPANELRRAFAGAVGRGFGELANHPDPQGWPPLRREIARYLVGRGLECTADDVAIVNGVQQAIDLVARVLVDPGDTVVLDQPGYFGAAMAFTACRAHLVGVGVDAEGLRTEELARVLRSRRAKLVYTTPASQSPTGAVLGEERRQELLALADAHQTPIFEDDYDSELRYRGSPVAALKTLDRAGQVVYAGTFSKVLFPTLRIGYVVAARPLLQRIALARWNADVATATLPQAALVALLRGGGLERHIRRMRKVYARRLAAMIAALEKSMPEGAAWTEPRGGHSLWLRLPKGADGPAIQHGALEAGIAYTRGDAFHIDGQGLDRIHLSFATLPAPRIAEGIGLLGAIVRKHAGRTRARPSGGRHETIHV